MGTDPFLEMQKSLGLTPKLPPSDNPYYQYQTNTEAMGDAGYNPYDQGGDGDASYNPYDQGGDSGGYNPGGGYNPSGGYNPGGGYNPPTEVKADDANDKEHTYWKKSGSIEYDADDLLSDLKNL